MNRWVEERVEAIRLALRVGGFPREGDLCRLVEWLEGCVLVRRSEVPVGMCVHREDGRAVITLPRQESERQLDEILCEELGHYLHTRGMAALLRQIDPESRRTMRLARRWEWRDEALAREFVRAWYLPSRMVAAFRDDEELAWRSGCAAEVVRRRRESLAGEVVVLAGPPRWSAAREYRLLRQRGAGQSFLQAVRRGSRDPSFVLCVRDADSEERARQVAADLVALTVVEFALKYSPFGCEPGEPVDVSLADLETWASQDVD